MKIKSILLAFTLFVLWQTMSGSMRDPNNPPTGRTGAPGETTCGASGCHSGGTYTGTVSISGIPDTVVANQTYAVTLTNTSNAVKAGFELTCLDGANAKCGTLSTGTGTSIGNSSTRQYVRQSSPKTLSGGAASWTFNWKAPASLTNTNIKFYFISLAANGNGNKSGDNPLLANKSAVFVVPVATQEPVAFDAMAKLYPNSASEVLNVDLLQDAKGTLTIMDIQGRTVLETVLTSNNQLDISNLTKGIYIARIQANGQLATKKFLVN